MPRQAKPFFRKQTQSWYCSFGGKQFPLGKERAAAFKKFHDLMASKDSATSELVTLYDLSQAYLDWCQVNRKNSTYQKHRLYLRSFIEKVGKRLKIAQLKQYHLTQWIDSHPLWSANTGHDAISIVQRLLNWGVEQDFLVRSPIGKVSKPRRRRRDIVYTDNQWAAIMAASSGPVKDLLDFLFTTGCRPFEARTLETRHVHGDLVIFPAEESKGESEARVVYLPPPAQRILNKLIADQPEGPVFRNSRGRPWTANAIKCATTRISKKVGFRVIAYGARHSFATNALTQRGIDPVSLAHLMGHKDTAMVSRVYSHVAKNTDFLRKQAAKAARA